jgi:hypothetical protein
LEVDGCQSKKELKKLWIRLITPVGLQRPYSAGKTFTANREPTTFNCSFLRKHTNIAAICLSAYLFQTL